MPIVVGKQSQAAIADANKQYGGMVNETDYQDEPGGGYDRGHL
jgi:hypothetical protein